jgi:iron-sulfur cluster assembly protein
MARVSVLFEHDPHRAVVNVPLVAGRSLLDSLLAGGISLEHECGGKLACATCRVMVREGLEHLSAAGEAELDMLDTAGIAKPGARLACQAIAAGADVAIEIPRVEALPLATASKEGALPVSLSARAARHLAAQLAKRPAAAAVRLGVAPAGCSGLRYRVEFADAVHAGDAVFESGGIRIAVDAASLPHVQGTSLDLVQEGLERRLRFDNPNARSTCGCGESFRT